MVSKTFFRNEGDIPGSQLPGWDREDEGEFCCSEDRPPKCLGRLSFVLPQATPSCLMKIKEGQHILLFSIVK